MRNITDRNLFVLAVIAVVLTGGLLLLPLGLAAGVVLVQRREELRKGELDDAKNY